MMRINANIVLMLALAALLLAGCASTTPVQRYATAQDTFNASVRVLLDAKSAGLIDQPSWDKIVLPAVLAGNALLDKASVAAKAGDDLAVTDALNALAPVLAALASAQAKLPGVPTSGPSNSRLDRDRIAPSLGTGGEDRPGPGAGGFARGFGYRRSAA